MKTLSVLSVYDSDPAMIAEARQQIKHTLYMIPLKKCNDALLVQLVRSLHLRCQSFIALLSGLMKRRV